MTKESVLFHESKETNIFMKSDKLLCFCSLDTGDKLETFYCLFPDYFSFSSSLITMSRNHLFHYLCCDYIQIKTTALKTGCEVFKTNTSI